MQVVQTVADVQVLQPVAQAVHVPIAAAPEATVKYPSVGHSHAFPAVTF